MKSYLLENTPETLQMLENLKTLLQSDENANVELAFQIIAGNDVPRTFYQYLKNTNNKIFLCHKYGLEYILYRK